MKDRSRKALARAEKRQTFLVNRRLVETAVERHAWDVACWSAGTPYLSYAAREAFAVNASYFATCPRDAQGHCLPSGQADTGKAMRAAGRYRDTARRRRVIAAVKREGELAGAIGAFWLP